MIVLIRHATPIVHYGAQLAQDARQQQVSYDGDCSIRYPEIDEFMQTPMYEIMQKKRFYLFASPLSRAQKTCAELFEGQPVTTGNLSEAESYIPDIPFIKLPFRLWTAIGRCCWLANVAPQHIESKSQFHHRIKNVYKEITAVEGNVCIVAHGIVNYTLKNRHLKQDRYAVTHRFQSGCFTVEYLEKVVYL